MSFESFIDSIEELVIIPAFEKQEGGYFYPEKYRGNLYRHNDKLMYITDVAVDEIRIPLIEAVYKSIESGITEDVRDAIESISDNSSINTRIDEINDDIDNIKTFCETNLKSALQDLCTLQDETHQIEEKVDDIFKSSSPDAITLLTGQVTSLELEINKLKNAKPSFNLELIQKLIDKKFEEAPTRVGKIKISTLSMLKESGFSIEEIGELAKNELI